MLKIKDIPMFRAYALNVNKECDFLQVQIKMAAPFFLVNVS